MSENETAGVGRGPQDRLQEIRAKLDAVKAALRDNELNVLNKAHHASWDDIEWLLDALAALDASREPYGEAIAYLREAAEYAGWDDAYLLRWVRQRLKTAKAAASLASQEAAPRERQVQERTNVTRGGTTGFPQSSRTASKGEGL